MVSVFNVCDIEAAVFNVATVSIVTDPNMARPASSPEHDYAYQRRKRSLEEKGRGNNEEGVEPPTHFDNETSARTCKTVDALLHTDAFVLDGEWFYAVAVEGEDAFAAKDETTGVGYWGLQVDSKTQMVYYYNHARPEEIQWLPPADLIRTDTHEVLLWDPSAQWFYYYNPQTKESRWLNEKVTFNQLKSAAS